MFVFGVHLAFPQKKGNTVRVADVKVMNKPAVTWLNYPLDSTVVGTNIQTFSCLITSKLPLAKVETRINGIISDVYGHADFSRAVRENLYEQVVERTVTLRTGANVITLSVTNSRGVTIESTRRVIVDPSQISLLRNEKDLTAPMVYLSAPSNIREDIVYVYDDLVKVTGTVVDESGIQSLQVNGITTPLKANGAFLIYLPVSVGENQVIIESKDLNQNIGLKKFVIVRKNMTGSEYKPEGAKNYLVVIGINNYEVWPRLFNAVQDADAVKKVLQEKYTFEPENTTMLLDTQATKYNVFETLRKHIEKVSSRDNLVVYFSGHGYFDKLLNEGYWVPADGKRKDISSYVPNSQVLKVIENINSQHTLVVADACFSGSLFSATTRGYVDQAERYRSRWGLASGRLEEVSDGIAGMNSPFASSFIAFLSNNNEPKVAVSDLVQYVKKVVAESNNQAPIGNPLKGVGDEGGEFVFHRRNNK
jgi:hypothetical protein